MERKKKNYDQMLLGATMLAGVFVNRKPASQPRPNRTELPRVAELPARLNGPCPCGSGRKYKKCCYAGRNLYQRRKGD